VQFAVQSRAKIFPAKAMKTHQKAPNAQGFAGWMEVLSPLETDQRYNRREVNP
jgi:hypothetical protein